jgi:hypothetical protein
MVLAQMLDRVTTRGIAVENFASFLAHHPPIDTVTLVEPTSWSCAHGVERWRSDCGCRIEPGTSQAWRAPLRQALEWLKGELDTRFEREAKRWFADPWSERDAHDPDRSPPRSVEAAELLEQQRHALRMFTSCGWFFDDIAGIESLLCLRHAARAIDLAGEDAERLRAGLRERLAPARSNQPEAGTGADLLASRVLPRFTGPVRVAAGLAAVAAVEPDTLPAELGGFEAARVGADQVAVRHRRTGRVSEFASAVRLDGIARMTVELTGPDGMHATLGIADVPEPTREILRASAQRRLLETAFDAAERDALAKGTGGLAQVLERAMLRHLGEGAETAELDALWAALDLLALDARPVPFDVQTRFYHLCRVASEEGRTRLRPLAPWFGFAEDCEYEAE